MSTGLHYRPADITGNRVRDGARTRCDGRATYCEDASRLRNGAPRVLATLRNTAVSLLRLDGVTSITSALRRNGRDPYRSLRLLRLVQNGHISTLPRPRSKPPGATPVEDRHQSAPPQRATNTIFSPERATSPEATRTNPPVSESWTM